MPSIAKKFDSYRIYYMCGGNESPLINCYDGGSYVGKLCFHKDGAPVPPNALVSGSIIYLRYTVSQFNDVIGILRYEKPLFLRLSTPSLIGYIATSQAEPVGEEES
jgi:hypothetical protein